MSFMNFNLSHWVLSALSGISIVLCGCKTVYVTRGELEEVVMRHSRETICNLWYIGTKDSLDFVIFGTAFHTTKMALPSEELNIADRFPLTQDRDKWLLLLGVATNGLRHTDIEGLPILRRFISDFELIKGGSERINPCSAPMADIDDRANP